MVKVKMKYRTLINTSTLLAATVLAATHTFAAVTSSNPGSTGSPNAPNAMSGNSSAGSLAVSKTLTQLFTGTDHFYPNIQSIKNIDLNSDQNLSTLVTQWTQQSIDQQLNTLPYQISVAYASLSGGLQRMENPLQDAYPALTKNNPSFDTLYLPDLVVCTSEGCHHKPQDKVAQQGAAGLNFNSLLGPNYYSKTASEDQSTAANNFIKYALQTYQPMIATQQDTSVKNKTFFQTLNDKLLNAPSSSAANKILTTVMNSSVFQKYWLTLRSNQAQNSLILSNFNYFAAERTPQKDLGAAYGLKTNDASPMQVEAALMGQSVYNPKWYQHMKTATPATLAREQLMMSALQVRLLNKQNQLSERNLATLSLMVHTLMQQNKSVAQTQDQALKAAIFPGDEKKEQADQQQAAQQNMPQPPSN